VKFVNSYCDAMLLAFKASQHWWAIVSSVAAGSVFPGAAGQHADTPTAAVDQWRRPIRERRRVRGSRAASESTRGGARDTSCRTWRLDCKILLLLLLHWFNGLCSGTTWTICKSFVPLCRQITTPAPQHSVFTGRMPFLRPTTQRDTVRDPVHIGRGQRHTTMVNDDSHDCWFVSAAAREKRLSIREKMTEERMARCVVEFDR